MLLELPASIERVRQAWPQGQRGWLVGGVVRDLLLNRRLHDVDLATDGDALGAARRLANSLGGAFFVLDAERGVGRALVELEGDRLTIDVARLRGEGLEADLRARDFTFNAMALDLAAPEDLIDPLDGYGHLRSKQIVACAPSAIQEDPVRAVRAVRFAAQLGFRLATETRALVRAADLSAVSAERMRDELLKCVGGPKPVAAIRGLEHTGLLGQILPEVLEMRGVTQSPPHQFDVWEHTLSVVGHLDQVFTLLGPVHDVDAASDLTIGWVSVRLGRYRHEISARLTAEPTPDRPRRWIAMLAALLHDVGKPATRTVEESGRIRFLGHEGKGAEMAVAILERLRFSRDEINYVRDFIAHHMRPRSLSRAHGDAIGGRAIYRFFRDAHDAAPEIVLLSLADFLGKQVGPPADQTDWSTHVSACAKLLAAAYDPTTQTAHPPALVTGDDLQRELMLKPGPIIGRLLEAIREAQAAGEVVDREGARAWARTMAPRS